MPKVALFVTKSSNLIPVQTLKLYEQSCISWWNNKSSFVNLLVHRLPVGKTHFSWDGNFHHLNVVDHCLRFSSIIPKSNGRPRLNEIVFSRNYTHLFDCLRTSFYLIQNSRTVFSQNLVKFFVNCCTPFWQCFSGVFLLLWLFFTQFFHIPACYDWFLVILEI